MNILHCIWFKFINICVYIYILNLIPSLDIDIFYSWKWIQLPIYTPNSTFLVRETYNQNVGVENVSMEPMRELLLLRIQRQASVSRCGTREDSITRWDEGISRDVQIRDLPWFSVRRLWYGLEDRKIDR